MTGPETLSQPQLNRALLARQSLLERADVTTPAALESMGGLQAQRAQILPERHRAKVFHTRMPQSVGTFLVDGAVQLSQFEPLPTAVRRAVDQAAGELAALHGRA